MIDDLKYAGINDELKEELIDEIGYGETLELACQYKKVKENIEILKEIGINNIETLLLNRSEVFLEDPKVLLKKIQRFNIPALVNLINEDFSVIDELNEV